MLLCHINVQKGSHLFKCAPSRDGAPLLVALTAVRSARGCPEKPRSYRRSRTLLPGSVSESGFTTYRCMTRLSGRAPKIGSYPSFASQSVASSVISSCRPCFASMAETTREL